MIPYKIRSFHLIGSVNESGNITINTRDKDSSSITVIVLVELKKNFHMIFLFKDILDLIHYPKEDNDAPKSNG